MECDNLQIICIETIFSVSTDHRCLLVYIFLFFSDIFKIRDSLYCLCIIFGFVLHIIINVGTNYYNTK